MSEIKIKDGTGGGTSAGVDSTHHLRTRGVTEPGVVEAAIDGNGYFVTSGGVILTSATASAMGYFINNNEYDILINRFIFSGHKTTGGTDSFYTVNATLNPTGVTGGTGNPVLAINNNFGSFNILDVTDSEIGQEGATLDGGTPGPVFFWPVEITSIFESYIVLPKGTGIGFTVTPPAGNTSFLCSLTANMHKIIKA